MIKVKSVLYFDPFTAFLYFFLFAGFFNDIIRLGSTQLTLFRLLLPVAFVLIVKSSVKIQKLYFLFLVFAVITLLQSFSFSLMNDVEIALDLSLFLTYLFYYFCVFTVIGSVIAIRERDKEKFENQFVQFLCLTGLCYLLVFAVIYHVSNVRDYLNINNQNDYGAMLTMLCPIFFYRNTEKKELINYLFILFVLIYLVLNDCKLALLGLAAQIFLVLYIWLRNRTIGWRVLLLIPAIVILSAIALMLNAGNIAIHGYDWQRTIVAPIKAMVTGELYPQSNTSVTFRVNTFIVSTKWMIKTKFMGIGIGNSGILVRKILGSRNLYESWMVNNTVSLHNAFLEFILELGVVALAGLVAFIRKMVYVLREKYLDNKSACFIVVSVSGLLWLQGPSGVLVDYLIFAVFAFLISILPKKGNGGNELL